MYVDQIETI